MRQSKRSSSLNTDKEPGSAVHKKDVVLQHDEAVEIILAVVVYAIKENSSAFLLDGLRLPQVLFTLDGPCDMSLKSGDAAEICRFQEQLLSHIVSLSGNLAMQQQVWRFNEIYHEENFAAFEKPVTSSIRTRFLAMLVFALIANDKPRAVEAISRLLVVADVDGYPDRAPADLVEG